MAISDLLTVMVSLFAITFTAIGGIGIVLFKMNGKLGELTAEIRHGFKDVDRRLNKLEKKRR